MRILITPAARAVALKAIEITDKLIDRTRITHDELQVDSMMLMALQGALDGQRTQLQSPNKFEFDWTFEERRALGLALLQLKAKVNGIRQTETKMTVSPRESDTTLNNISDLISDLTGQEKLFTGDTSWSDPKPPKAKRSSDDDGDDLFDDQDDDTTITVASEGGRLATMTGKELKRRVRNAEAIEHAAPGGKKRGKGGKARG